MRTCKECEGTGIGMKMNYWNDYKGRFTCEEVPCGECNGTGYFPEFPFHSEDPELLQ